MKQKRRGFTLVEILTVVAIIAVLVEMLFLGARYVGASARSRKTQVMLKSLESMFEVAPFTMKYSSCFERRLR